MPKTNCRKIRINAFRMVLFFALLTSVLFFSLKTDILAAGNETISFQGKIVRNDTGYEGLNISAGTPACVVAGDSNDTCDFRASYYTASSGGTLLGYEDFANEEIGAYAGVFNLSLGAGSWTSGSETSFADIFGNNDSVYVELKFAPDGSTLTETFSRMQVSASAYAIRAGRADIANEADSAFQFDTATDDSGYSASAGMVYYDSDENVLKVYNGSSWVDIVSGSVSESLFTDSGEYTYLTDTSDSFVLGTDSYTEIGVSTYADHLTGLASSSVPFAWDYDANRLVLDGSTAQTGLTIFSSYASTGEWPLVSLNTSDSGFASPVLEINQAGTGSAITAFYGTSKIFEVGTQLEGASRKVVVGIGVSTPDERLDIDGAIHIHDFTPSTTTNRLYSVGSVLYWNGSALASGSTLWTDGGTFSYLTSTSDDLVLGASTVSGAPFFFDVSDGALTINGTGTGNILTINDELSDSSPFVIDADGNVGIGTSSPSAKLDIAGTSSRISNNSGDIVITAEESVVIKADDTDTDNIMEWMSSTGGILAYIDSYGKLALSAATVNKAQIKLASSTGVDVASPSEGDLWWNGDNLYFNNGVDDIDLLTTGRIVSTNDYLFKDGFETGDVSNWSYSDYDAYSSMSTQTTIVKNGNYAQKFSLTADQANSRNAYVRKDLSSSITEYYTSFYFYLPSDFNGASGYWEMLSVNDSTWDIRAALLISNYNYIGINIFDDAQNMTNATDTTVLTREVWHKIELYEKIDGTYGSYSVQLDGEEILSDDNIDTGTDGAQFFAFGSVWSWYGVADDLYMDDIRISPNTNTGGYFLSFLDSGAETFLVDADGDLTTKGDLVTEGTLTLGSSGETGSIRYNATDHVIEFTNDGSTWVPLGSATRKIVFSPEYAGAVLASDGSSNTGIMTSDSDTSSKNYYEWSSSETSLNDYDVRVRFTLPGDFESWSTTAVTFNLVTEDTGTNSKADIYLYLASSATIDGSSTSIASGTGGVWTTTTIAGADLDECNAANETCMLILRMYSANDSYTRIGDIELNYNRSL